MSILEALLQQDEETEKEKPEGFGKQGIGQKAERNSLSKGESALEYVPFQTHLSISFE